MNLLVLGWCFSLFFGLVGGFLTIQGLKMRGNISVSVNKQRTYRPFATTRAEFRWIVTLVLHSNMSYVIMHNQCYRGPSGCL